MEYTSKTMEGNLQPAPPSKQRHPKEFLDPQYWNPECSNFEIIDWSKFYGKNPSPPKIFDPPQKHKNLASVASTPLWWWNRSWFCKPLPTIICGRPKPNTARISDDNGKLISHLLGPNPNSDLVPIGLRNRLIWTENNIAPETLISFNRWAWRTQSDEGRVVGLGNLRYDWTNDPTCFGYGFSIGNANRFAAVQTSPDGMWMILATFSDPGQKSKVNYLHMYVVQDGDVFKTPDGNVLDHVKPGDLVRISWGDGSDPYECDNDNLKYHYFPRVVATLDETKGIVTRNDEHYSDLLTNATSEADMCCETCCYTCTCCWSAEGRFDFQVNHISDLQIFETSPDPPTLETIDRL